MMQIYVRNGSARLGRPLHEARSFQLANKGGVARTRIFQPRRCRLWLKSYWLLAFLAMRLYLAVKG